MNDLLPSPVNSLRHCRTQQMKSRKAHHSSKRYGGPETWLCKQFGPALKGRLLKQLQQQKNRKQKHDPSENDIPWTAISLEQCL